MLQPDDDRHALRASLTPRRQGVRRGPGARGEGRGNAHSLRREHLPELPAAEHPDDSGSGQAALRDHGRIIRSSLAAALHCCGSALLRQGSAPPVAMHDEMTSRSS